MHTRLGRPYTIVPILPILLILTAWSAVPRLEAQSPGQIFKAARVKGGLVVHVGCGDGKLTAQLRPNASGLVQGLDTDPANVTMAREHIQSLGLYGNVSADRFDGEHLPYIDNMVNLLVVSGMDAGRLDVDEIKRVLAPRGVAVLKGQAASKTDSGLEVEPAAGLEGWKILRKPVPPEIDEWTHYLHDPSNNAVAHDTVIGPLGRLQWLGSPKWARHHDHMSSVSAAVTSGGRVFCIFDEAPHLSIALPSRWSVIARDAFNGTILWKRPIKTWHSQLMRLKSGPADLPRRLVAVDDRVFVTLGYRAPVTCLDAATGETIREFKGTAGTQEIIVSDGTLLVFAIDPPASMASAKVTQQGAFDGRWLRDRPGQRVMAMDAKSGELLWEKASPVAPLSLAADSKRVLFYDGGKIVCLDKRTGDEKWVSDPLPCWKKMITNFGVKLVLHEDIVLFVGGEKMKAHAGGNDVMTALSADTGKKLWSAPHPQSGYQSPEDLLVVGGLVWCGATTNGRLSGRMTGRDVRTGEVVNEFDPNVPADTYWFHHRCYMGKATDKYLLMSRTGIEFIDPEKKDWDLHHWARGACLYGIMPANGLIYSPQHPCACYPEAKMFGFNALAPLREGPRVTREIADSARLEKGPVYGKIGPAPKQGAGGDWPTYRGGNARHGYSAKAVPTDLKPAWRTQLKGKLSPVVVAGGQLFVASVDDHTVHALDEETGKKQWSFTAGGRVDSPPTVWNGRVIFGSADGVVYCLRAGDGALVWRFLAAPMDERLVYFEQVESVWPVHGSVLVLDAGTAASGKWEVQFVAGRSMFLDGGLRHYRLNAETGEMIGMVTMDDRDPESGKDLQERHQVLQMPVALADILASDGKRVYMKSQVMDLEGKRGAIGPHSGKVGAQASVQAGEQAHIFCPSGYLDDTWWHRTYWVYGRSFSGGHAGYYRAGLFTPSGRILVSDGQRVFGFGRKPRYYKWTAPLEHHLFSAKMPVKLSDQEVQSLERKSAPKKKKKPAAGAGKPGARKKPAGVKKPGAAKAGPAGKPAAKKPNAAKKKPGKAPANKKKGFVPYVWTKDMPMFVRAMTMTGKTIFIAGPPDLIDEEVVLKRFNEKEIKAQLHKQAAALAGKEGVLLAISAEDGGQLAEYKLDFLPAWDGMAAANGKLYMSTLDGQVVCFAGHASDGK